MRVFSVIPTLSAQHLEDLLGTAIPRHVKSVGLQAPRRNRSTIYVGDAKIQPVELRRQASAHIPESHYREIYVRGNGTDSLTVVLFNG